MRLIDADAIEPSEFLISLGNGQYEYTEIAYMDDIRELPAIDAVPVIRCKDCRWGEECCGNIECWPDKNYPPEYHGYYWFCPNGERKEE